MRFALLSLIALVLLTLAACGAGGGDDGRGVFLGPAVSGLQYESPSHSGVTDQRGRFHFEPGEPMTFRLGATVLGTAPAQAVMTPIDLVAGVTPPTTNRAVLQALFDAVPSPASRLINLLVLLQTLDADDDLANGIQIPDAIAPLLADTSLDLARSVEDFQEYAPFRRLVRNGLDQGLWGGAGRPIRQPDLAIDLFYGHADIPHGFARQTRIDNDRDGDGIVESRTTMSFPDDRSIVEHFDVDVDGVPESESERRFSRHGALIRSALENRQDNVSSSAVDTERDASDNIILRTTRHGGVVTQVFRAFYDDLGLLIRTEIDDDGDGDVQRTVTFTRNADGRVERKETDTDGNGEPDRIETFVYGALGLVERYDLDNDGDGRLDQRITTRYDARGRQVLQELDLDPNGSVDRRVVTTFDDARRIRTTTIDNNGDEIVDEVERVTLDAQGRELIVEHDTNADGVVNSRTLNTYEANREINRIDTNADGNVDIVTIGTVDGTGNTVRFEQDNDADGDPEFVQAFFYEPGSAFFARQID